MSLVTQYKNQFLWRDWKTALAECPIRYGDKVLDLGCGPGDLSRELVARGATVTGIDLNEELLLAAKENCPNGCNFISQDLRFLKLELGTYDGLWSTFTSAYLKNFESIFKSWLPFLRPRSWVCLIDIDDLLNHEPLTSEWKQQINLYYKYALSEGMYDFRAGRSLQRILEKSGYSVKSLTLEDAELSFDGPANHLIYQAWKDRFERMSGLRTFLGKHFAEFQQNFLETLLSKDHRSLCKVICCIGTR